MGALMDTAETWSGEIPRIEGFIRECVERWGFRGVVLGISGGVDSAVVGSLAVRSLGAQRVLGLFLPERDSDPGTRRDARRVASHLGVPARTICISPLLRRMGVYRLVPPASLFPRALQERYVRKRFARDAVRDTYLEDLESSGSRRFLQGLAYYRSKHRLRTCVLYFEAEKRGYAVIGSTNRTELRTGLYVKWGDDARDLEPVMHLYKTEVCGLARELEVPASIRNKAPSPDLAPGLTDEFVLGLPYRELDRILVKLEGGESLSGEDPAHVQRVRDILARVPAREVRSLQLER